MIPIHRVCAYDRRKVFCVRRTDVTLEVDGSFYFNQDALAVRATIRVGFGFRMPPRWSLSVPAVRNGLRRNRSPLTPGGWASVLARPLRRSVPVALVSDIHYGPSPHLRGPSPGEVAPRWLVRFPFEALTLVLLRSTFR